ncbi:MAG: two pore domain potassium channel family protein [Pseudomonadaceae bacterium]|nr:two pore domain potassium channel family protein [Pseudomonadaceae bacterium]
MLLPAALLALVVLACVMLHYEGLSLLDRLVRVERRFLRHVRPRILLVVVGVLMLHVVEIWLFAGSYRVLEGFSDTQLLMLEDSISVGGWFHYVYFSSVVYTTVGFGEIVPVGVPLRLLAASESLLGLVLIAWSASFTYLQMQRLWGRS